MWSKLAVAALGVPMSAPAAKYSGGDQTGVKHHKSASRLYLGDELDLHRLLGDAGLAVPTSVLAARHLPVCRRLP